MSPYEQLLNAARALWTFPIRTLLTALGIAVATAATTTTSCLGTSVRTLLDQRLDAIGPTMLVIRPGTQTANGHAANSLLTLNDLNALNNDPALKNLTYGYAAAQFALESIQDSKSKRIIITTINGLVGDAIKIRRWPLAAGRSLTLVDSRNSPFSAVIGHTVLKHLYGDIRAQQVIGRKLKVGSVFFTIVGVLLPRGKDPLGRDHDDQVFTPLTGLQVHTQRSGGMDIIIGDAQTIPLTPAATERTQQVLRQSRQLQRGTPDDMDVTSVAEMGAVGTTLTETLNVLTTILATIALIVGGIGTAATLTATAASRIRETGIRLAVGATSLDVTMQLLLEGMVITMTGGFLGIMVGLGLTSLVTTLLSWPMVFPPTLLGVTVFALIGSGILAAIYPALSASQLKIIDAIRAD
ncbi:MAG: ABC transporter permease [Gemmatales bacterium]